MKNEGAIIVLQDLIRNNYPNPDIIAHKALCMAIEALKTVETSAFEQVQEQVQELVKPSRMMIIKFDYFDNAKSYRDRIEVLKHEFKRGFVVLHPAEKALIVTETGEIKCID